MCFIRALIIHHCPAGIAADAGIELPEQTYTQMLERSAGEEES